MKNTIVLNGLLFFFTMLSLSVFGQEALNDEQAQAFKDQATEAWLNHQYAAGLDYSERALKYYQKTGNRLEIADLLNMITLCHIGLKQPDKAFYYFENMIPAYNDVNADLVSTLLVTGHIALEYRSAGKIDPAIKYLQRLKELANKLGVVEYVSIAVNKLGDIYHDQNEYGKALEHYQEGLRLVENLQGEMADLSQIESHKNIGGVCLSWGKFDQALQSFEKGLTIARRIQQDYYIAYCLLQIGRVYEEWASFDKAYDYFKEASGFAERTQNIDLITTIESSTANIYAHAKQYDQALFAYEKVLRKAEQNNLLDKRATILNNMAYIYDLQGRKTEALNTHQKALELSRIMNNESRIATSLNNIGMIYLDLGKRNEALNYFQQSLSLNKKLGQQPEIADRLNNIGATYCELLEFNKAILYFEEAVQIKEQLRKTATGAARRDYLASQIFTYQYLTKTNFDLKRFNEAFRVVELSKAKQLGELISATDNLTPLSSQQGQNLLPPKTAVLTYSCISGGTWDPVVLMIMDNKNLQGLSIELRDFLKTTTVSYKPEIQNLLAGQRGMKKISSGQEESVRMKNLQDSLENIVIYYRHVLTHPSAENLNRSKELGRKLYDLLIKPAQNLLADKTELIIIPDGVLGVLPFETLLDESNQYLIQAYEVRYVHSLTILNLIQNRRYSADRKSLIAFGGAVYDQISYAGDMIRNPAEFEALQNDVYNLIASRGALNDAYAGLGLGQWANLPGTLEEVQEVAKTVKGTLLVTGAKVTEELVKAMSGLGELSKFRVVHFATHGLVTPELPELSAIVLSQLKSKQGNEDGYLRMGEIAALKLNADFVNLSACETGLGKIYGGEGVVGLTQSFLISGANALSVSLWQVSDVSTAKFMVGLYDLVEHRGLNYTSAITEMKRKFIHGEFGEQYKAPYYWAPFIFYGASANTPTVQNRPTYQEKEEALPVEVPEEGL